MFPTDVRLHPKHLAVATRGTSGNINRHVVLNLLRIHQPMSRADLARRLGMQRAPVGRIIGDLMAAGLVHEGAVGQIARGRRPRLLFLDSPGRCGVAVDVRVTRTSLVITDLVDRELSGIRTVPTERDPTTFVTHVAREVSRLMADHKALGRLDVVGIAFPPGV